MPRDWHHCGFWLISHPSHSTDVDFKFRSEPNTVFFFFPHEEYTSQKLNYFLRASSCITDSGLMTFSVPLFRVKSGLGIVFLIHIRWIFCYRKKRGGYCPLVSFLFATFMQPHKIFTLWTTQTLKYCKKLERSVPLFLLLLFKSYFLKPRNFKE